MLLPAALVLVLLTFARTLSFSFVNWDDELHVTGNPAVIGGASVQQRLLTPSLGYPIPVTVATYAAEHALFGSMALPYHATNLLLHLAACVLLWCLARRVGLGPQGAAAAVLLFGLHPVVAEPVSWVTGRKDLLAAFFALAATNVFLGRAGSSVPGWPRTVAATTLFALAALSKPVVLALPLAWLVAGRTVHGSAWRPVLRRVTPVLVIAAAVAVLGLVGQSRQGAVHVSTLMAWGREIWYSLGYHLGLLTFVQLPLAKHIPISMPPPFEALVDLLPVGLLVAAAVAWRRRGAGSPRPVIAFGAAWAVAGYFPSSNVIPLTRFLADSYLYLPLAGIALLAGAAVEAVLVRVRRPVIAGVLGAAATGVLMMTSLDASASWRDGVTLWSGVFARYPDSPEVCQNLGNAWFERGALDGALETYRSCARRFGPKDFNRNMGVALARLGRFTEARLLFQEVLAAKPDDAVALSYMQRLPPDQRP